VHGTAGHHSARALTSLLE